MNLEDIILVATVREDIREHAARIDATKILRVEVAQTGKLTPEELDVLPAGRKSGTVS
jgi:hypothetical protein